MVSGLPPVTRRGTSAFFPHYNRMAASGAQEYKDGVYGYPGTKAIPVTQNGGGPRPPSPDLGDLALAGTARASDAPNAFWPNLYYVLPERNYRPGLLVQMYDPTAPELTTMIPVPAVSYRQDYIRRAATLSMGLTGTGIPPEGNQQIRQPVSNLIGWMRRRAGNGLPQG